MIWPGSCGWFALGMAHAVAVRCGWAGVNWRLTGVGCPRGYPHMTGRWCLLRVQPGLLARAPKRGLFLSLRLAEETCSQWRLLPELAQCQFHLFHWFKQEWSLLSFKVLTKEMPSFVRQVSGSCGLWPSLENSLLHWALISFIKER